MLITFSGLDGAGKSTLIEGLKAFLEEQNHSVTVLTMYNHVGVYAIIRLIRDWLKKAAKRRKQWIRNRGNLNNPERLRAKDVKQGRDMSLILYLLRSNTVKRWVYVMDLFILLLHRLYLEHVKKQILILDRYFYDSLADVADGNSWFYIRMFMHLTPTPDVPIFVDVSPEKAFSRKGEYSVGHLKRRRPIYMKIFQWVRNPVFIPNNDLDKSKRRIEETVLEHLPSYKTPKICKTSK
jgi:thymidylate kinase